MSGTEGSVRRRGPRRAWGGRTTLFQFDRPPFYLYVFVVCATAVWAVGVQSAFRDMAPSGWALSWGLLLVYALPVFLLIYFLDLYEREPLSLVIGAFVWGAIAATTLAGLANEGWGLVVARLGGPELATRWTAALTAPWTEETLKALGVLLIMLIAPEEVDDEVDGFVCGAVCGLGFAVVEDVFYFIGVFGGSTGGVLSGFYVRVLSSGLYGHVLYTALAGIGLAYFFSRRGEVSLARRTLVAVGLFLVAVAGHFLWDSPLLDLFPARLEGATDWLMVPVAATVKGLPMLLFVVVLIWLAHRRERRWIGEALAPEVGSATLSATELGILLDPRARRRSRRAMRARAGPGAARLLRRLQREQVNLAMVRARVDQDDDPDLVRQREYCRSIRDALLAVPGAASAASVASQAQEGRPATPDTP